MDVIIVQFLSNVTYPVRLFKVAALLESPTFVYFESRFTLVLYIACTVKWFLPFAVSIAIKKLAKY